MSNICTSNVTSGFIDLATFDEIEKYLYGGPEATAYFVRETRKATWFTQVPVVLSRASGNPGFGTEFSVSISRAGDYLLSTWLRLTTPKITTKFAAGDEFYIRWTNNFMHNLINEACITFNDLVAARFDNYHLDFWSAFTVPAGKRNAYNNMIGNRQDLTTPSKILPEITCNLPLPFFFTRDSGVSLPTAALPYNDMRINFSFRPLEELLVVDALTAGTSRVPNISEDIEGTPVPQQVQVWANYAIVSNDERKRMACAPRDILIEQVQTAPRQTFAPKTNSCPTYDIRFSHPIKVLFFAARNTTVKSQWSNYTATSPPVPTSPAPVNFDDGSDPIINTSIIYENTSRLSQMGSDYYSLIQPYYHAPVIPSVSGYHLYSYSLDFMCLDPMGSTNYGKLTNVSICPQASQDAVDATNQSYEFIVTSLNNNIVRVSGGALGFPVL